MNANHDFDRIAQAWLAEGPEQLPDRVLDAVADEIHQTRQRHAMRLPWRNLRMNQMNRALAGIAAVAVVLVGGVLLLRPGSNTGVGGPPPSAPAGPSGTPSGSALAVPALTDTFTSARYGFSVRYPSGWTVKDATKPWSRVGENTWGSGINDELSNATARFSGASQALAAGQTADQWVSAYANGADPSSWPPLTIGGQAGKIDYDGVPAAGGTIAPGGLMYDAVVVVGNRAYNFNMDGNVDRATFDAFLATVVFDPASAADLPGLTQAFTSARHGYTISLPSTWTVQAATAPWPAGFQGAAPPDPMLDVFTDPSDPTRAFVVVSQPLAKGVTPDAWLTVYEKSAPSMPAACWPAPAQMERTTIDGQPAWIHGGLSGCGFSEAVAFAGGRIYEISAYFPSGGSPLDRRLFDALLATVRFDPAAADDSPGASPRSS